MDSFEGSFAARVFIFHPVLNHELQFYYLLTSSDDLGLYFTVRRLLSLVLAYTICVNNSFRSEHQAVCAFVSYSHVYKMHVQYF